MFERVATLGVGNSTDALPWRPSSYDEGADRLGSGHSAAETAKKQPGNDRNSGVAPANQTKDRAKTKSSWISPIFVKILVFFLRKTSTIHISNFCSGMPPWKVHETMWSGFFFFFFFFFFLGLIPARESVQRSVASVPILCSIISLLCPLSLASRLRSSGLPSVPCCALVVAWKVHELTFLWFGLPGPTPEKRPKAAVLTVFLAVFQALGPRPYWRLRRLVAREIVTLSPQIRRRLDPLLSVLFNDSRVLVLEVHKVNLLLRLQIAGRIQRNTLWHKIITHEKLF